MLEKSSEICAIKKLLVYYLYSQYHYQILNSYPNWIARKFADRCKFIKLRKNRLICRGALTIFPLYENKEKLQKLLQAKADLNNTIIIHPRCSQRWLMFDLG